MTIKLAIGIDLGTTFSCVGIYRNEHVEIFTNNEGFRITPSYVSFDDKQQLTGYPAFYQIGLNPHNTIYDIKRIIGRNYNEENVQSDINCWPFKVIEDNNRPLVQVKYKKKIEKYTAEEISSMVLSEMKGIAEDYLGETVTDAVITVPAYFNDTQRKATIDAGKIAGLNVLRIINEPTAAALAYGFNNKIENIDNILVVDFGGGTYDVSLLSIYNGKYEVKAISGDTHLGGEDINNRLIDYFIEEIKTKYGKNIKLDPDYQKIKSRLRLACERGKIQLSSKKCKIVPIEIVNIFDGINFKSSITRTRFEHLCKDLFDRLLKPIENVIKDSKIEKSDVNEIVLIGGSTRIPKVQEIISNYFDGKELKKKINPDEAVAYGASILASILSKENEESENYLISDVVPLSLGTSVRGSIMSVIINRNTKIPVSRTETYFTMEDNQTSVLVDVYEGENDLISNNKLLDKFTLRGITPAPRGVTKIDITFEIDKNGILKVSASENGTNLYNEIRVVNNLGRLYQEKIERIIRRSNKNKEYERKNLEKIESMNRLEDYAYKLRTKLENIPTSHNKTLLIDAINNTLNWVKNNTNCSKEEYDNKKVDLEVLSTIVFINKNLII
eukprot:jgi/Orpsp1_1/1191082/evm.model.d7180000083359.1